MSDWVSNSSIFFELERFLLFELWNIVLFHRPSGDIWKLKWWRIKMKIKISAFLHSVFFRFFFSSCSDFRLSIQSIHINYFTTDSRLTSTIYRSSTKRLEHFPYWNFISYSFHTSDIYFLINTYPIQIFISNYRLNKLSKANEQNNNYHYLYE